MRDKYLSDLNYISFISKRSAAASRQKKEAEIRKTKNITASLDQGFSQDMDDTTCMIEEFMTKHQGDTDKVQYITKKERKL